ncbi:MAG: SpvB/TcaC N-terminal domain-containing protein [Nitrospiria bacterium]
MVRPEFIRRILLLFLFFISVFFIPCPKSLNAQVASVEGKGSVLGNSGAFFYSVPIDLPPAVHSLIPNLTLSYSSAALNGFLGVGWNIPVGYVMRSTKSGVNYNCNSLTATCYVYMLGDSSSELVPRTDWCSACYGAKIEGAFIKFQLFNGGTSNAYWQAIDKSGTKYWFGQTSASRQDGTPGVFKWNLGTVTDTHNNSITYSYFKDQGEVYIDHIDYQTNHIQFTRDSSRTDVSTQYTPTFAVTTAYRLSSVDVYSRWNGSSGNLYKRYALTYNTSGVTNRSLLTTIRPIGSDGVTSLPVITFTSQNAQSGTNGFINTNTTDYPLANSALGNQCLKGDLNGDGKTDFWCYSGVDSGGTGTWNVKIAFDGLGWNDYSWSGPPLGGQYVVSSKCFAGDLNGDGKTDTWCYSGANGVWNVSLSTGTTWTNYQWTGPVPYDATNPASSCLTGDLNGDGLTDMWCDTNVLSNGNMLWNVGISTGTGWSNSQWGGSGPGFPVGNQCLTGDINGDGKTDFWCYTQLNGSWDVRISNGNGWNQPAGYWSGPAPNPSSVGNECFSGDLNGDGLTDTWCYYNNAWTVSLSSGTAWTTSQWFGPNPNGVSGSTPKNNCMTGDLNGDGRTDIWCYSGANGDWNVGLSTGNGWNVSGYYGTTLNSNSSVSSQCLTGDLNGDGQSDTWCDTNILSGGNYWYLMDSQVTYADRLTSVSNGIGGNTAINYLSTSNYWSSTDTIWNLPFNSQVVYLITNCDNYIGTSCVGNSSYVSYRYAGGYFNAPAREFRGFNYGSVVGANNTTTETWYYQGNGRVGSNPDNPSALIGYLKGRPYKIDVKDSNGTRYSERDFIYWPDSNNGAGPWYFTPVNEEDSYSSCEVISCVAVRTVYTFDDHSTAKNYSGVYGNLIEETFYASSTGLGTDKYILHGYNPNTSTWIVGLPSYQKTYQSTSANNLVSAAVYQYDNSTSPPTTGNLTKAGKWYNLGSSGTACGDPNVSGYCFFSTMAYDSHGNVTSITDPNNNTATTCYDSGGTFPQVVTNAKGQSVLTDYYGVSWNTACGAAPGTYTGSGLYGQVKSLTDPNIQQTKSSYDLFGRKTQDIFPDGSAVTKQYNNYGTVGSQYGQTNTTIGLSSWIYFDGFGRTITEKKTGPDSKTIRIDTRYNNLGQMSSVSLPYFDGGSNNGVTSYLYDAIGRTTKVATPDGQSTQFCYPYTNASAAIDPNSHVKRQLSDRYGNVIEVDEFTGTYSSCPTGTPYSTTKYTFNALNHLTNVLDGNNNPSTMNYDSLGRKTSMIDPDMGTWSYQYDNVGNMTQQTDAKSQNTYFRYDVINRITQKDYGTQKAQGSGDVVYTYDTVPSGFTGTFYQKGHLSQVVDSSGTSRFGYDNRGKIIRTDKIVSGTTYMTTNGYDSLSRVTSVGYPDLSQINYTYNGPLLWKVTDAAGGTPYAVYSAYNALQQPSTVTYGNGAATTYTYDNR